MFSKVVGSTFVSNGQSTLATLKEGNVIELQHEPENPFDSNAVVVRQGNRKLGHLPRATAEKVVTIMKRCPVSCHVSTVTGGGQLHSGCNLSITWDENVVLPKEPNNQSK